MILGTFQPLWTLTTDNIHTETLLSKNLSQPAILKSVQLESVPIKPLPQPLMTFHLITVLKDGNTKAIPTMLKKNLSQNVILKSTSLENAPTKDK